MSKEQIQAQALHPWAADRAVVLLRRGALALDAGVLLVGHDGAGNQWGLVIGGWRVVELHRETGAVAELGASFADVVRAHVRAADAAS